MTLLAYSLLIGLGAYRLFRIFATDQIMAFPRDMLYVSAEAGYWGTPEWHERPVWKFLADLMSCPWCIGFWYSGALAGLVTWHESYGWSEFALLWLAGSTVCGLTKRFD